MHLDNVSQSLGTAIARPYLIKVDGLGKLPTYARASDLGRLTLRS